MGYFSSNLPAHSPSLVRDLDLLETENTIRIRTHVLIEKDPGSGSGSRIRFKIRTQKIPVQDPGSGSIFAWVLTYT